MPLITGKALSTYSSCIRNFEHDVLSYFLVGNGRFWKVTELVLEKSDLQDEEVMEQLCRHVQKSNCRKLSLAFCKVPYSGIYTLIRVAKESQKITDLNFSFLHTSEIELEHVEDFVDQLVNTGLSHLRLQGCEIPLRYCRRLLAQELPALKSLVYLDLSYSLKDDKHALLLIFKNIPHILLRELFLNGNGIGDEDIKELCQYIWTSKLEVLSLSFNNVTDHGLNLLGPALFDSGVHTLDLSYNKICGVNISFEKLPPNLTNINLGWNKIEDIKIFSCLHSSIIELNLVCTFLGDEEGEKLLLCLPTNLRRLNISCNGLSLATVRELANFIKRSNLTTVNISDNAIPAEAFCILGEAVNNSKLQEISLGGGYQNIQDGSVANFINVTKGSALVKLIINHTDFEKEKVEKLTNSLENSNLTYLDLSSCIFSGGITTLASCLQHTIITYLNLSDNGIDDKMAVKLAEGLENSKISCLDLSRNLLTFEGAQVVASIMMYGRLHTLILKRNELNDEAIEELAKLVHKTYITCIDVSYNPGWRMPMVAVLAQNRSRFNRLLQFYEKIKPVNGIDFRFDSYCRVNCIEQYLRFYKIVYEKPSAFNSLAKEVVLPWEDFLKLISEFPLQLGRFVANHPEVKLEKHIKFLELAEELGLSNIADIFLRNLVVRMIEENEEILNPTAYQLLYRYKESLCNLKMEFHQKSKVLEFFQFS